MSDQLNNYILLITDESFGESDRELGKKLMSSYLYTLEEGDNEHLPTHILLLNEGVKLATKEPTLSSLRVLEEKGVEIMACGICVEYFDLEEDISVGQIGNMYLNMELMAQADKVITIG
ncbi:sulfurtransferase-like selenium metabolism protein YedF [Natranaerobius thermophilus]|uniref:SirA family protein n=1 Tax=Natranaerobius thermophilus (strain ATCC BAA-1301 / DSM 18059 / JW/NM-WN-LF) TaxID=457570 RepID=B2A3L1_NATTJ|nr:sulfurtransferase-like selenium metabolism protein YedF [Natranaerobius thermophilus]ACB86440.1 SirA family protein [Natranaerobius thermophilus JW/NM-WN-LF]